MTRPTVVNMRAFVVEKGGTGGVMKAMRGSEAEAIYIGRPSKWGNPFVIGADGYREQVVAAYRAWIQDQPHLLDALPELAGKTLVCFCAPKACHGDVLADLVEAL